MKIYIGNLSFDATEDDLLEAFECFGPVESVHLIRDPYDGRSRGFGFVEMPETEQAENAISKLDGSPFMRRTVKVTKLAHVI